MDYDKFKDPFFEIKVGDSTGKRMVNLPHHILRLCQKIEITETFEADQYSMIQLTFIEGSREPASQDPRLGTKGLYHLPIEGGSRTDLDIAGSITNRVGTLADLRFSGSSGITFTSANEIRTGKIDNRVQKNVDGANVTRSHTREPKSPVFLFQERNQVQIRWGYKSDPSTVRSIRGYIVMLNVNYPDSAQVTTTITCHTAKFAVDQIAPRSGVPFGTRERVGGNSVITFKDPKSNDLIKKICSDAGLKCIVSDDLLNANHDRHHMKVWVAGESFAQFLNKLAEEHDAVWDIIPDPKTGEDTLIFLRQNALYSRPIKGTTILLAYKQPGSILHSVEVNADFGFVGGFASLGTDPNGDQVKNSTDTGEKAIQLYKADNKTQQVVDYKPTSNNPVKSAQAITDKILNGQATGKAEINPSTTGEQQQFSEAADVTAKEQMSRAITLGFQTLGYTRLSPGAAFFDNLGVRYSGTYRIINVTHTLEPGGYTCRGNATSYALSELGIPVPEAEKPEGKEKQVTINLFKPAAKDTTVLHQFNKFRQTE